MLLVSTLTEDQRGNMATFTEEQFAALIAKMSEVGATPGAAASREVAAANPLIHTLMSAVYAKQ